MTPSQINQAIAEECGYVFKDEGSRYPDEPDWQNYPAVYTSTGGFIGLQRPGFSQIPNYHGSLDAMAAAEETLTEEGRGMMIDALCVIVRRDHNPDAGPMTAITTAFFATAAQRAEAFLRIRGKWAG